MSSEQGLLEWLRWIALMGVDGEVVMLQGGALERCAEAAVEIERLRDAGDALVEAYAFVVGHPPEATRAIAAWREARRER